MTSISQLPAEEILKAAGAERARLVQIYIANRGHAPTSILDLARVEGATAVVRAIKAAMQDRE